MKILVIDDNQEIQALVAMTISKQGYELLQAEGGAQGLELAKTPDLDLILLDLQMPDMDGFEVCRCLKEDPLTKEIPVLFLTVADDSSKVVQGLKLGAVDYIRKPFAKKELLARIQTHVELKQAKAALARQVVDNQQLLHVLAHDLTNPIAGAMTYLDLILQSPQDDFLELASAARGYLQHGMEVINLTRQIRALDEGKTQLTPLLQELLPLALESQGILQAKFNAKGVTLELDIPPDLQALVENTSFVNSVLNNLLTNALKFSFPGNKVELKAQTNNGHCLVSLRDYGLGMPPQLLANLFSMTKPTSRTGTQGESGTGFGMPLVQKFVQAYGGSIEVESWEKGHPSGQQGTHIQIHLRLA